MPAEERGLEKKSRAVSSEAGGATVESGPAMVPGKPLKPRRGAGGGETSSPSFRDGLRQALFALPFASASALLVAGCWLLVAVAARQWTQVSVLTLGLTVPWVFYNMSVRKRVGGGRVRAPAPVALVSILSFAVSALTAFLLEYLVFRLVYSNTMKMSGFVETYFGPLGWALVILSLVLALLSPPLLRLGSRWDVSRLTLRRTRKQPESNTDRG